MGSSDKVNEAAIKEIIDLRQSIEKKDSESKLWRKAKENPFVPAGIFGGLAAVAYSALNFKNKGETKLSVYLIHTRVAAQGAVVSAMMIGALYQLYQQLFSSKTKNKSSN